MATSLGDLSQAELTNIVGGLTLEPDTGEAADPDDILKQLGETAFDNFETFFTDLTNATASSVPPIEIKVSFLFYFCKIIIYYGSFKFFNDSWAVER